MRHGIKNSSTVIDAGCHRQLRISHRSYQCPQPYRSIGPKPDDNTYQSPGYDDAANPYREGVVVDQSTANAGQRVIWLEKNGGRGESYVTRAYIEGLGGWQMVDRIESMERVLELIAEQEAYRQQQTAARDAKLLAERQQRERGQAWLEENRPEWATSVIVAELHEDVGDRLD